MNKNGFFLKQWIWFCCLLPLSGVAQSNEGQDKIDWKQFMGTQDMLWTRLPQKWEQAPFLGNGCMGAMIYQEPGQNAIHIEMGNSYVHDHGSHGNTRLMIGYFSLNTVGAIVKGNMRLDLWNAELTGLIQTTKGTLEIRAIVHSVNMVSVIEVKTTGAENQFTYQWHPAQSDNPRLLNQIMKHDTAHIDKSYVFNPSPVTDSSGSVRTCTQKLIPSGETVTAWKETRNQNTSLLAISIFHSFPSDSASGLAVQSVNNAFSASKEDLFKTHEDWWHAYYPESFLSIPDKMLENFYWAQLYKLASATRSDRCLLDLTGPWLVITPWPDIWWNLNEQLAYSPVYAANKVSLGNSLAAGIFANTAHLSNNAPPPYRNDCAALGRVSAFDLIAPVYQVKNNEFGNLPWALHNVWQQYRYSMDDDMGRNNLYPILKKSINLYFKLSYKGSDGKYHLSSTSSPEYGTDCEDANYDLSLFRWGCQALLDMNARYNLNDPSAPRWKNMLDSLTDYPSDNNGYMIGKDLPYGMSHRHYSHLLMIYPLYVVNTDQPGSRDMIQKSLDYWQSKKNAMAGFSYTGASSISSALGKGNDALSYLMSMFKNLLPNTLYEEAGSAPVIETPLSAATSIEDMLIQSWGGKIRVFPAVPDVWKDVVYDNMRAEGAFLVSAKRTNGVTAFIRIKSLKGEPCILKTDMANPSVIKGSSQLSLIKKGTNEYQINLTTGQEITIAPKGSQAPFTVEPVASQNTKTNFFGLN